MEIRLKIKLVVLWKTIILLGIIVLLSACFHSKKEAVSSIAIIPDEHTLLAITPEFSIKMAGNTQVPPAIFLFVCLTYSTTNSNSSTINVLPGAPQNLSPSLLEEQAIVIRYFLLASNSFFHSRGSSKFFQSA